MNEISYYSHTLYDRAKSKDTTENANILSLSTCIAACPCTKGFAAFPLNSPIHYIEGQVSILAFRPT